MVRTGTPTTAPPPPGAAVIGAAMRSSGCDGAANALQTVGKTARVESGLNRDHAAADVHTDSSRNNRALCGDHAANGGANAPVNVGHGRNPFEDERKLCDVQELLARLVFERHAPGPGLDRHAIFNRNDVVVLVVRHRSLPPNLARYGTEERVMAGGTHEEEHGKRQPKRSPGGET